MKKFLIIFCTVALLVTSLCVPAFAHVSYPDDLPALPNMTTESGEQAKYYFIYESDYNGQPMHYLFYSNTPCFKVDGSKLSAYISDGICYFGAYTYRSGNDGWSVQYRYDDVTKDTTLLSNVSAEKVVYSSYTIKTVTGEDFFLNPPLSVMEIQQMAGEVLQEETATHLSILVPFGVGCLALLTGLVLLSRKFRVFLP